MPIEPRSPLFPFKPVDPYVLVFPLFQHLFCSLENKWDLCHLSRPWLPVTLRSLFSSCTMHSCTTQRSSRARFPWGFFFFLVSWVSGSTRISGGSLWTCLTKFFCIGTTLCKLLVNFRRICCNDTVVDVGIAFRLSRSEIVSKVFEVSFQRIFTRQPSNVIQIRS